MVRRSSTSDGPTRTSTPVTTPVRPRSRPSASPDQSGELLHPGEIRERIGVDVGVAAAVPPHERGERLDLGRVEAAQLTVLHEVRAVAVMPVRRHVLPDVVEQARVLE